MNTRASVVISSRRSARRIGLAYAWLIEPVTFSESSPAQVMKSYREAWLIMAAEAYAQDGDWERTQARVNALRDANLPQTLADLFERYQANGPNPTARALARLADRLNVRTPAMQVYLAAIITPTPEIVPTHRALRPRRARPIAHVHTDGHTRAAAHVDAHRHADSRLSGDRSHGRMHPRHTAAADSRDCARSVRAECARQRSLDHVGDGGADRFVTGLKPEIDPGYGDFDMQLDQSYNVGVDKPTSVIVSGLRADLAKQMAAPPGD